MTFKTLWNFICVILCTFFLIFGINLLKSDDLVLGIAIICLNSVCIVVYIHRIIVELKGR